MKREIITTRDGSHTIAIEGAAIMYHSIHGAIRESLHVFIKAGLMPLISQSTTQPITIFEMGFGTGLNAFLTAIEAGKNKKHIHYTTIEQFPLIQTEIASLNYGNMLKDELLFNNIHEAEWNKAVTITGHITLTKIHDNLQNYSTNKPFNLIYYDAFAPAAQPELWTEAIFSKLYQMLSPGGILVTYCSKGDVRRALLAAGFAVEKLPGPHGKREMLRAGKNIEQGTRNIE